MSQIFYPSRQGVPTHQLDLSTSVGILWARSCTKTLHHSAEFLLAAIRMLEPHGDLTDRHVVLTIDEFYAVQDGHTVMRGNGRFCTESWITERNNPDMWNKWTCVRPEPGRDLIEYGGPGGRKYAHLQVTTVWWIGRYRGIAFHLPKHSQGPYNRVRMI